MNDNNAPEEIRYRNPVRATGFAQIPYPLLIDWMVSDGAVRLYAILLTFAQRNDNCWPSVERLARDLHVSRDTISVRLKELETCSLITRERRVGQVTLTWIEDIEQNLTYRTIAEVALQDRGRKNPTTDVGNFRPRMSEKSDIEEEPLEEEPPEEEPLIPPAGGNQEDSDAASSANLPAPGNGDRPSGQAQDQRDHCLPQGAGEPTPRAAAIAAFDRKQAAISRVLPGRNDEPVEEDQPGRVPKWAQPETTEQLAFLKACGAVRFQPKMKARLREFEKAMLTADLLRPEERYQQAIKGGPQQVLPRDYFELRLAQASEHHWSLWDTLRNLGALDYLFSFCNRRLRELAKEAASDTGPAATPGPSDRGDQGTDADFEEWYAQYRPPAAQ